MSEHIFPPPDANVGIAWENTKQLVFSTATSRTVSQKEHRVALHTYPVRRFRLTFRLLDADSVGENQFREVQAFYMSHGGNFESFLFQDTEDNEVTEQGIGIGDNVETDFQIIRTYGGTNHSFVEPIYDIDESTLVVEVQDGPGNTWDTKTSPADYTYDGDGVISFTTAPGNGIPIRVSVEYFFRVRFDNEGAEYEQMLSDKWRQRRIDLISARKETTT